MKKIKIIFVAAISFLINVKSYSQVGCATVDEIKKLQAGTLLVDNEVAKATAEEFSIRVKIDSHGTVTEYNCDTLNKLIKDYFTNEWKFCKVKFVADKDERKKLLEDENNFYFYFRYYESAKFGYFINFQITKKNYDVNTIANFPVFREADLVTFFKPAMETMQQYMNLKIEGQIKDGNNCKQMLVEAGNYYNQFLSDIKEKELYLVLGPGIENFKKWKLIESYKEVYPYKVRIATRAEVKKAFEEQNENVVIAFVAASFNTFIETKDYKVIYFKDDYPIYDMSPPVLKDAVDLLK